MVKSDVKLTLNEQVLSFACVDQVPCWAHILGGKGQGYQLFTRICSMNRKSSLLYSLYIKELGFVNLA